MEPKQFGLSDTWKQSNKIRLLETVCSWDEVCKEGWIDSCPVFNVIQPPLPLLPGREILVEYFYRSDYIRTLPYWSEEWVNPFLTNGIIALSDLVISQRNLYAHREAASERREIREKPPRGLDVDRAWQHGGCQACGGWVSDVSKQAPALQAQN